MSTLSAYDLQQGIVGALYILIRSIHNYCVLYYQFRWNYVVTFVPMWVAPNLITITGLAINMIAALLLIYHCPSAREEVKFKYP